MTDLGLTRRGMIGGVAATAGLATVSADVVGAQDGNLLNDAAFREYFLAFSADATGFPQDELVATDQADVYFGIVRDGVGDDAFEELLQTYHDGGLARVLSSPKSGAIARNIIKLWYSAVWERLPEEWRDAYGVPPNDKAFTVSANAYATGLLWVTIGANPPAANAPGFGTWSDPPEKL